MFIVGLMALLIQVVVDFLVDSPDFKGFVTRCTVEIGYVYSLLHLVNLVEQALLAVF